MLKLKKLFMGLMAASLVCAGLVSCNNDDDDSEPGRFTVSVSKSSIGPTETTTLTSSVSGVTYSITSGSDYATLADNVVTGVSKGSVEITAAKDGYDDVKVNLEVNAVAIIVLTEGLYNGVENISSNVYSTSNLSVKVAPADAVLTGDDRVKKITEASTQESTEYKTYTVKFNSSFDSVSTSTESTNRPMYFPVLTGTLSEETVSKKIGYISSDYLSANYCDASMFGTTSSGKGIFASVVANDYSIYDESDGTTSFEQVYGLQWAAEGITDVKVMYPITFWNATSDNKMEVYAFSSKENYQNKKVSAKMTFYYEDDATCPSQIKADFEDYEENVTASAMTVKNIENGENEAYENQYEGNYTDNYRKSYSVTLTDGENSYIGTVEILASGITFSAGSYYNTYLNSVWTKSGSSWKVNCYSDVSYLIAGKAGAAITFNGENPEMTVSVCNSITTENTGAIEGYDAWIRKLAVPVSLSGKLETASASLSCYVTAMGGQEFGSAVYKGYTIKKNADETYSCTLKLGTGVGVIFTVPFKAFVDPTGTTDSGSAETIPGYYDTDGNLVTLEKGTGYTVSETEEGIAPNLAHIKVVDSITFPVSKDKSEYKLWLYVNSNMMGVQFGDGSGNGGSNEPNVSTPYVGKFTLDWDKAVISE